VVRVQDRTTIPLLPFVNVDAMDEPSIEALPKNHTVYQSYLVQYCDPSGRIESYQTEPLIAGKADIARGGEKFGRTPNQLEKLAPGVAELQYNVQLEVFDGFESKEAKKLVIGPFTVASDSIWVKSPNPMNKKLAKYNARRIAKSDRGVVVLHPNPAVLRKAIADAFGFPFPVNGNVRVTVINPQDTAANEQGKYMAQIHGTYSLGRKADAVTRRGLALLTTEFKIKELGASENMRAIAGTDDEGNSLNLILEVLQRRDEQIAKTAELKDIEVRVPLSRLQQVADRVGSSGTASQPTTEQPARRRFGLFGRRRAGDQLEFTADPLDIDHMTGLCMALEERMANVHTTDEQLHRELYRTFETVNAHRQQLEHNLVVGQATSVTPKINAAVHMATQQMWKAVHAK
jgi:hypothetical protein